MSPRPTPDRFSGAVHERTLPDADVSHGGAGLPLREPRLRGHGELHDVAVGRPGRVLRNTANPSGHRPP
jgi:hypothetical protein